ncbi:MAG: hypothetical protein AAF982_09310, partial [Pseudomonadota bacterium]
MNGGTMSRENITMRAVFFAQHPGNQAYRAREAPITNRNFADMVAFHNRPEGRTTGLPCTPVYLAEKSSDMLRNMREYHDDPVLLKVELPEGAELQPDFATLSFKGGWFTNIQDGPLDADPITGEYHVYSSGKEGSEAFEERFWHLMDDDQKIPVSDVLEPDSEAARIAREFTGCVVTPAGIAPGNIEHVDFKELDPK